MKRVKYLNNRDLLAQIHASKNTYCSYVTPEDARYDLIVPTLKKVNASAVAQARKAKAKRLTQEAWEQAKAEGLKKIKLAKKLYPMNTFKLINEQQFYNFLTKDNENLVKEAIAS